MTPILAAESITKSFGRRKILSTAGAWATPGRITAILGRNGCGKTTLVKIACGLMSADHGVVIFDGDRLTRPRLWQLARRGLFFLPERNLLLENVPCGRHLEVLRHHIPAARVDEAVERLAIAELLPSRPRQLSGGERRRVELALAVARQPRCLVADEPFLGIAPLDVEVLQQTFREMAAAGTAILVTGHEVRTLLAIADEVIWHTAGTTHALGSPEEARNHYQFGQEYLTDALSQ